MLTDWCHDVAAGWTVDDKNVTHVRHSYQFPQLMRGKSAAVDPATGIITFECVQFEWLGVENQTTFYIRLR